MAFLRTSHGDDAGAVDEMMAEINIIPLVDVMLVLLIIFMVAAPLSLSGIQVRVPEVSQDAGDVLPQQQEEKLVVVVQQDGSLFYQEQQIALDGLTSLLAETAAKQDPLKPTVAVIIQADQAVTYAKVIEVMNASKSAGLHRIGLVVRPEMAP